MCIIKQDLKKIKCLERFFMKLCAIISEFNPFTNGHAHIISEAKQKTGCKILSLMSGNFVQRGQMAILDKYKRAQIAIAQGADFVFELPLHYAISPAEKFAEGAVKCLYALGVSYIAFGTSLEDNSVLEKIAKIKANEPQSIKNNIKSFMKQGLPYTKAIKNAYLIELQQEQSLVDLVFSCPNNILALEYLTTIIKHGYNITPIYVKRTDGGYNSAFVTKCKINNNKINFASASYIRSLIENNNLKVVKKLVPQPCYEHLKTIDKASIITANAKLDAVIINKLRTFTVQDLYNFFDFDKALASTIYQNVQKLCSLEAISISASNKTYRQSRIKRLLFLSYFGITKDLYESLDANLLPINALAVKADCKQDLSKLIKLCKSPILVSSKDYQSLSGINKQSADLVLSGSLLYNICNTRESSQDLCKFI